MNKRAILAGIDTHPANSLALALRSVGYDVAMLSDKAMDELKKHGYEGGVRHEMLGNMGYHGLNMPIVELAALDGADMFVDLKKRDLDAFLAARPEFAGKVLCYLINGGGDDYVNYGRYYPTITNNRLTEGNVFWWWPPFDNVHGLVPRPERMEFDPPLALLHAAHNWGFGHILQQVIDQADLRVYGSYGSPMGIIRNDKLGEYLSTALAFVHPKASDAPGYALYEAFASAVPVVATQLLVERMRMQDLFEDEKTCLLWGKTSYVVEGDRIIEFMEREKDVMIAEICASLERLKDPVLNSRIGMMGYKRWRALTEWTPEKQAAFGEFLKKNNLL